MSHEQAAVRALAGSSFRSDAARVVPTQPSARRWRDRAWLAGSAPSSSASGRGAAIRGRHRRRRAHAGLPVLCMLTRQRDYADARAESGATRAGRRDQAARARAATAAAVAALMSTVSRTSGA